MGSVSRSSPGRSSSWARGARDVHVGLGLDVRLDLGLEAGQLVEHRGAAAATDHDLGPPGGDPAPVVRAPQPGLELGHRRVERRVEVLGAGLGTADQSAAAAGQLDALAVLELAAVAFMEQLHLQSDDLVVVAFQASDLLGDMDPEMFRDLDVPAGDNDLHADFPRFQRRVGVADTSGGCPPRSHDRFGGPSCWRSECLRVTVSPITDWQQGSRAGNPTFDERAPFGTAGNAPRRR